MQHICLQVIVGTRAAQPLLYCTVMVTHSINTMQVLPTVPPVSCLNAAFNPPLGRSSLSKIKIDFHFTPLHRLIGRKISRCFVWVWGF